MFHLLIVEDIDDIREQLKLLLIEEFPESIVDVASTVYEGSDLIEQAKNKKWTYHVVILDFKLPEDKGLNPEVSELLCDLVKQKMPEAFIIHITAFSDDLDIISHLTKSDLNYSNNEVALISKLDEDWADKLIRSLKAYLYGSIIEDKMYDLFGRRNQKMQNYRNRQMNIGSIGSITYALADLFNDISAHWHDLSDRLQKKIEENFYVNTENKPIRVSLIKRVGRTQGGKCDETSKGTE